MDGTTLWMSVRESHAALWPYFQGFKRDSLEGFVFTQRGRTAQPGYHDRMTPLSTLPHFWERSKAENGDDAYIWFSVGLVGCHSRPCLSSTDGARSPWPYFRGLPNILGRNMVCRSALRCCLLAAFTCCLLPGCRGNITVAVMLPDNHHKYPWALPRVFPAILMAHEDLQSKHGLLLGRSINIWNYSTEDPIAGSCAESRAQVMAVDAKLDLRPDAFFGPGCVYPLASVGRFASHWKLPLITAGGPAYGFDKREEYQTIVRSGPSTTKLGDFTNALHTHFNWTSRAVVIFHDLRQDDRPHYFLSEGIYQNLKDQMNITVEARPYEDDYKEYKDLINFMKDRGRSKSYRKLQNN